MDESEQQADSAREGRVCLGGSLASAGDAAPFRNDTGDFYGRLLSAQLGERDNSKHLAACYFLPDSQDCFEPRAPFLQVLPQNFNQLPQELRLRFGPLLPATVLNRPVQDQDVALLTADAEPVHRPRFGPGFGGDVFQKARCLRGSRCRRILCPACRSSGSPVCWTPGASVAAAPHLRQRRSRCFAGSLGAICSWPCFQVQEPPAKKQRPEPETRQKPRRRTQKQRRLPARRQ